MSDYELYPIEKLELIKKIRSDIHLYEVFRKQTNLTPQINEEMKNRLTTTDRPNWVVVQILGATGGMKSSAGMEIITQFIDPQFTVGRISMQFTDFEENIGKSEPRQAFMLDEQVFQRGTGSLRMKENFINLVETLRKRQNSLVVITPNEKMIGEEHCTFMLEPCGFNKITNTLRLLVKKRHYLGFYYLKIRWNSELWDEYEEMKNDFLEITKSQQYKKFNYLKNAKKLIKTMPPEYEGKIKRIKLHVEQNAPNITKEERDLLVEQIKILQEG